MDALSFISLEERINERPFRFQLLQFTQWADAYQALDAFKASLQEQERLQKEKAEEVAQQSPSADESVNGELVG